MKSRQRTVTDGPKRATPVPNESRYNRATAIFPTTLRRAEALLARTRKEVERLRRAILRGETSSRSEQLLKNLEALLSLQTAHCDHLAGRPQKGKGSNGRAGRKHKAAKKAIASTKGEPRSGVRSSSRPRT